MKVSETRHVEDCFDGSLIVEILFQDNITKENISAISSKGTLHYYPNFARPFFKIRVSNLYDIKGIEGNNTLRIQLKDPEKYSLKDFLEEIEKN